MKLKLKHVFLTGLALLLSACGFHLQGEMQLAKPLHNMYLQAADPYGHLARNLRQYLKMSHVQLAQLAKNADTTLAILSDESSETLLSVSGTQITRKYLLTVNVTFEILGKDGATILPPQTLSESRVITVDSSQILGSSNEAALYYQQMRSRLANAIMTRIASSEVTSLINQSFPAAKKQKKK